MVAAARRGFRLQPLRTERASPIQRTDGLDGRLAAALVAHDGVTNVGAGGESDGFTIDSVPSKPSGVPTESHVGQLVQRAGKRDAAAI